MIKHKFIAQYIVNREGTIFVKLTKMVPRIDSVGGLFSSKQYALQKITLVIAF